jgi:hypothetical protein
MIGTAAIRKLLSYAEIAKIAPKLCDEIDALRAENAKLREALKGIFDEVRASLRKCGTLHTAELLEKLDAARDVLRDE